eukprot:EG_transcript_10907
MSLSAEQRCHSSRGDLASCPSGHTLLPGSVPDLLATATPRSPAVPYRRDSSCPSPTALAHALASSTEAPAAPRLRYSVTLVVGVVGLILLVGFLAWNVPFTRLQATIEPLGRSIRSLVMASVERNVRDRWAAMRAHAMFFRERWDLDGQPEDPVADVNRFGRLFQPLMRQFPFINIVSFLMLSGRCVTAAILQQQPSFGWRMTRQNCSMSWAEPWDAQAGQATGRVIVTGPRLPPERLYMFYPLNMSSRAQPFTWLPVYDPVPGNGKLFLANIALFVNGSNVPSGRLALGTSSVDLSVFLQQQIQGQPATLGGRMALYDPRLIIVATTHGDANRPQITAVGDADLEAAARAVLATGQWCSPMSTEITLSQRYFLDVELIADPQPSVVQLQWCAILLSPRDNTMQQVDHSTYFAVAFVCAMTFGSAAVAIGLGVLVTQPLHCLTKGMRALKEYDFACARQARLHSRVAWFQEMHSVMDSYGSLVEATYAFGKY